MTLEEKIEEVKILVNDKSVSDSVITSYLKIAGSKILDRCYPFKDTSEVKEDGTLKYSVPAKYDHIHTELTSRYIFRRGFEGQTASTENGVTRSYGSVDDRDLLDQVMQIVGVVNGQNGREK